MKKFILSNKFRIIIALLILLLFIIFTYPLEMSKIHGNLLNLKDGEFISFKLNTSELNLEVARSDSKQEFGLMFRQSIPLNQGMIFISNDFDKKTFWMKNTLIPLDIIFLDSNLTVVKFYQNTKINQISELYPSILPSQYVIEMQGGWAKDNKLQLNNTFKYI